MQCSFGALHRLSYPIQVHQVPVRKRLDADFLLLNADPFMMVHLGGAQYRADNARVFGLLTLWLRHADWWTYRRRFEATCNDRGIWLCSYGSLSTGGARGTNNSIPFRRGQTIYLGQFQLS
jgi:hypothetical protein